MIIFEILLFEAIKYVYIDLCSAVGASFNPNPDVVLLNTVYNVSDWMKPMRFGLHNVIYPHVFRFYVADEGSVKMQYKNWVNDPVWLPENSKGISILKVNIYLFKLHILGYRGSCSVNYLNTLRKL